MKPARGLLLVKRVDTEETLPNGKVVLPESVRESLAAYQAEVIAVGEPTWCETPDCDRLHDEAANRLWHHTPAGLVPGAWVVVAPRRYVAAEDGTEQFFARIEDVLAILTL